MPTKLLLKCVNVSDFVLTALLLIIMWRKRRMDDFSIFALFLACRLLELSALVPVLYFRREFGISRGLAYHIYLYSSWFFNVALAVLHTLTIYAIYRLAMRPLEGLQRIGQIIFRWVAGVSFGLAVFFAIGPHPGQEVYPIVTAQISQGISVLDLCVLLFVCLAIRPLGLTFSSHIFGVCLGLGISAATGLIESAWLPTPSAQDLYSPIFLIAGFASLVALSIWSVYFIKPDPERRMVLLPTTSPFFVWNSISEALGDDPGHVAISGFKPDMLADAELEELSRSSRHDELPEKTEGSGPDDHDDNGPSGTGNRHTLLFESFSSAS